MSLVKHQSKIRKVAPYLAIAAACFVLSWCSFSGGTADDTIQVPAVQQVTPPLNTLASNTLPTAPATAEPSLIDQIKALEISGVPPKLDRSTDIKGPDQNLNGVRDDVEDWIAKLAITEVQKKAAMKDAAVMQKTLLVDLNDKVSQQVLGDEGMLSTFCLRDTFMPDYEKAFELARKIESMTANTKERSLRYMQYNRARSGSSTSAPTNYTCPY